MLASSSLRQAVHTIRGGGVIAYPTEGVYGLGCLPLDRAAVTRILDIKRRDAAMGLVLIAARIEQFDDWVALPDDTPELTSSDHHPVTWIVAASDNVPDWIRGKHAGLAIRLTTHPIARALCDAADSALVSTSANLHGRPPARNRHLLRRRFNTLVDYIVPGDCGPAAGPSEIRELATGRVLRNA